MNKNTQIIIAVVIAVLGAIALIVIAGRAQDSFNRISNVGNFIIPQAHGLAGSLENLQNEVNTTMGYRDQLLDYINQSNVTLPAYDDFTTDELEQIARAIMSGSLSEAYKIISDKTNEELAPALDTFSGIINGK